MKKGLHSKTVVRKQAYKNLEIGKNIKHLLQHVIVVHRQLTARLTLTTQVLRLHYAATMDGAAIIDLIGVMLKKWNVHTIK